MPHQPLISAEVEIQAPFHDLDPMAVVWHGHYAKYFEIARCALLDKIDYSIPQMRDSGYAWPVIELFVRYTGPVRFGQRIHVRADLIEWENRLKILYLVSDAASGRRLTRGHTVQAAVQAATGEMCLESPQVLASRLRAQGAGEGAGGA
jgi:acyl-CoA thioester hydrolase